MIQVSPSLLSANFAKLGEEINDVKAAGADMLHLDVMDGLFVPNISFGLTVISSIRKSSDMIFDVHLMIQEPEKYLPQFVKAGADIITFHTEATDKVRENLEYIRSAGVKAAISVKPNTPIETVYQYLDICDMVLVMSVEPGFGGQSLIDFTLDKIRALREEIERRALKVDIQIDGGITQGNAHLAIEAGANILVAGSAVFGAEDRAAAIRNIKGI